MNSSAFLKSVYLLAAFSLALTQTVYSQFTGITIDEDFSDWNSNMATLTDGIDNPNGIDLLEFQVTNDQHNLYVKFTLDAEIALADDLVPHQLWLYIDADNNPNTGFVQQAGYGTELAINFNEHYAWFNKPTGNVQVSLEDIQLRQAPTLTSSTFEIAIPRDILPDSTSPLFTSDTIRILIRDGVGGDEMPNVGSIFSYTFSDDVVNLSPRINLDKQDPNHIRVVTYNTLFNTGWEQPGITHLERVLKALDADIYCFQEANNISVLQVKNYLDAWMPTGTQEGWSVTLSSNKLTCSRWTQNQSWELTRTHATLIDLPSTYSRDLLVVNGHLSCCQNNTDRQDQADEFAAFILNAKTSGGSIELPESTPFIFVGDMNLVGYNQQRKTIMEGDIQDVNSFGAGGPLDWDDTELGDAVPLHINQNMAYTWRSFSGNSFPPGRLDYQFYSDAVLEKEKAFVLQTEVMPVNWLTENDLLSDDTWMISDHLPVVVDYAFDELVGIKRIENSHQVNLYPNPAKDYLEIDTQGTIQLLVVRDLHGKVLLKENTNEPHVDVSGLAAGTYLLELTIDGVHESIIFHKVN